MSGARAASGNYDVLVVGAGVFGIWTACHLQRMGKRVAVVEAVAPAHSAASSGGESRVTRAGYGAAQVYSEWALQSLHDWRALSATVSLPLFHASGVLWIHAEDDAYVAATAPVFDRLQIPYERLDAATLKLCYPVIQVKPGEAGFFEPEAGGLMARRAVQTLAAHLAGAGVTFLNGRVRPLRQADASDGSLAAVSLEDGSSIAAERFVFACGPWLNKVCPDAMSKRLFVTRQEVLFFAAGSELTGALPVWTDRVFYGCPSLEGRGFKISNDTHGPAVDPDTLQRRLSANAEEDAREFMQQRFPSLAEVPLNEVRVCQYENSSNGDFVLDVHPGIDNAWIAGCGSGHGFKHGPAVGHYLARRLFDLVAPIERFSLDSKNEQQHREIQ